MLLFACIEAYMKFFTKQERLKYSFPMLTEANQQYMLGIANGLKYAQNNRPKIQLNKIKFVQGK